MNSHAERFVRSIKEECLNKLILFGAESLERAIREFVTHYHEQRPHQGLDNELINGEAASGVDDIGVRERLGGLLKYYHRSRCVKPGRRAKGNTISLAAGIGPPVRPGTAILGRRPRCRDM